MCSTKKSDIKKEMLLRDYILPLSLSLAFRFRPENFFLDFLNKKVQEPAFGSSDSAIFTL